MRFKMMRGLLVCVYGMDVEDRDKRMCIGQRRSTPISCEKRGGREEAIGNLFRTFCIIVIHLTGTCIEKYLLVINTAVYCSP